MFNTTCWTTAFAISTHIKKSNVYRNTLGPSLIRKIVAHIMMNYETFLVYNIITILYYISII